MKKILIASITLGFLAGQGLAYADDNSPVGLWKTIDDKTGKTRSVVRIIETNGVLSGKIEKIFPGPNEEQNPKCDKCTDARKDQPVIGMTFLSGLKKDGDDYAGGEILDPDNGQVYRSKITLTDSGKKLKVRGYVGAPIFGRSQVWVRTE